MKDELIAILADVLYMDKKKFSESTRLEDIIKDSMDIVELIAICTDKYHMKIERKDMNGLQTVGDLIKYVQTHKNTQKKESSFDSF